MGLNNSVLPIRKEFLIEIDRKGANDAVYYDCDNPDFEEYITGKGFQTALGSFSDISLLAPELGVAAVNLSSGYYAPHTLHENIIRTQLENVIHSVGEIVAEASDLPRFEYIEAMPVLAEPLTIDLPNKTTSLPQSVPDAFRDIYTVLLDFFSPAELESFRQEYGDHVLRQIYDDEIAPLYRR